MFKTLQALLEDPDFKDKIKCTQRKFSAHEKILEEGQSHNTIYLINKGKVRVLVNCNINEEAIIHPGIAELGPGHIFGELGLFDESPANADILSITEGELTEIDIDSLKKLFEENPEIGYQILLGIFQVVVERLRHADKAIVHLYGWGLKSHNIDKHLLK